MVGLYKDPEGKNVKIMSFTRESSSQQKEFGDPIDTEIKKLRRRVTELERNRQQAVVKSIHIYLLFCVSGITLHCY